VLIPILSEGSSFYSPMISMIGLLSIVYPSVLIFRQIDLKRIIAYSSVAHMNLLLLGLFGLTVEGFLGTCFFDAWAWFGFIFIIFFSRFFI